MFNRKTNQFDNILNDCLERILVKGGSIEECLAQYPQQADALKPLLETTLAARKALDIKPRPEFRARARYQFHSALREAAVKKQRRPFSWQLRWAATASLTLVLLTGSGVVAAASSSMPDSPLYQVKLATEQIQLFLTPATEDKAELYANLADRRVTEIVNMAEAGNVSLVELTTERLDNHLSMIAGISTSGSEGILSWGASEPLTTITTTKTVTATVGAGGMLTDGTSEPPTITSTKTVTATVAGAGAPPEGTLTIITTVTKTVGGMLAEGTVATVTTTVTTTVGAGGILSDGTSEPPTSTVTTTVGGAKTTTPGITTETAIKPGDSSRQPCVDDNDLACQLQQDSESNIAALYEALDSVPEEVKPALLQAIAVLENGYNNALNAIASETTD